MVEIVFVSWYFRNGMQPFNAKVKFLHLFMMRNKMEQALASRTSKEDTTRL